MVRLNITVMDSSSYTLHEVSWRGHFSMPKRLFFYLALQILVGFAFFSSLSFFSFFSSFSTAQIAVSSLLLLSFSNLYGLSQKHLWSYHMEYLRLLLGFFGVLFITENAANFDKMLFFASMVVFVSFLWLKIIKTVFGK